MLICGIKLTHDGSVAVISDNRLLFSIEVEKIQNGRRYSALNDLDQISSILRTEGLSATDINCFVVDGWYAGSGEAQSQIAVSSKGRPVQILVAPYIEQGLGRNPLHRSPFAGISNSPLERGYVSYPHASNHVLGAYCTSPFALRDESALVLAWDGGMFPRLYWVEPKSRVVEFLGSLFPLLGAVFVEFCSYFEPFRDPDSVTSEAELKQQRLEVAGKAMAYAALGTTDPGLFGTLEGMIHKLSALSLKSCFGRALAEQLHKTCQEMSGADLISTFQDYIGKILVESMQRVIKRKVRRQSPGLCLSGGCALNIKWNSLLRGSGMFRDIWIPPFPNDSGAAIGTACCEMINASSAVALDWNVYSGPRLNGSRPDQSWRTRSCSEYDIAAILHKDGEPVVVLEGRAELGPRALGNRSILAPAVNSEMKDLLNALKGRASYRPIAPICLESRAKEVFDPGVADPYMLFEHRLRKEWLDRLPAIKHLDGTARLQTIDPAKHKTATARILQEYERLSGIPVLCNTSANLNGHGFFPDIASATSWGRTRYVWADGILYSNSQL
jgi:carbamoyltransferase